MNRPNPPDAAPPGGIGVKEVAARAGVAPSSVSRVLSGHPDVSPVMHRRVLDAAAALGYEPNLLAQGLRRGSTMTVGFVVGDISNPLPQRLGRRPDRTHDPAPLLPLRRATGAHRRRQHPDPVRRHPGGGLTAHRGAHHQRSAQAGAQLIAWPPADGAAQRRAGTAKSAAQRRAGTA